MSYHYRVAQNVNKLLKKNMSNSKKIKNHTEYKKYMTTFQMTDTFSIVIEGENYTKYKQMRITKSAMVKNSRRIDEVKEFLNRKMNRIPTLDDISTFITYIICIMDDTSNIDNLTVNNNKLYNSKKKNYSFSNDNTKPNSPINNDTNADQELISLSFG